MVNVSVLRFLSHTFKICFRLFFSIVASVMVPWCAIYSKDQKRTTIGLISVSCSNQRRVVTTETWRCTLYKRKSFPTSRAAFVGIRAATSVIRNLPKAFSSKHFLLGISFDSETQCDSSLQVLFHTN